MHIFSGENINSVYLSALKTIRSESHLTTDSRVGKVFDLGPAYFEFKNAHDQFLTLKNRNYNPYFAIIEAAWILNGENTLEGLSKIVQGYDKYSDDGHSLNGAYGYRIKKYFGKDQLESVIRLLSSEPNSRRAVITLYSTDDLDNNSSRDIPCNVSICMKIRNKCLDITVLNRSNDIFLGIPYNVFVFNILQRHIAKRLNVSIGIQRHFTDSLHLYERDFDRTDEIIQTNSQEEIESWQRAPSAIYISECIIDEFEKISNSDISNIISQKTRDILHNYWTLKNGGAKLDFIAKLPYDNFGISSKLWAESKN
jgi:thymidylate synthase